MSGEAALDRQAYIRTFNRFELKYLIHYKQARALLKMIRPHVSQDINAGLDGYYKISSLYYDSPDLKCYWEKLDGESFRRKVRIRTYGIHPEDAFLEIKQRLNLTVQKRRCRGTFAEVTERMKEICAGHLEPGLDPVYDEVFVLARRYRFEPKMIISYQRAAFFDLYKADLRITLDRNIRCRNVGLDLATHRARGRFAVPPTMVLLEVKFNEAIPAWLCTCLNGFNFQVQRLSKYCVGIEQSGMIDP